MAKNNKEQSILPLNTIVEVAKYDYNGVFIGKKEMKLSEWQSFVKQKNFYYKCYTLGYCSDK